MNGNIFVDDEPDHPSAASGDFELRNRTGSLFFFIFFFFAAAARSSLNASDLTERRELGGWVSGWLVYTTF